MLYTCLNEQENKIRNLLIQESLVEMISKYILYLKVNNYTVSYFM